jgi:multiple sugar transport system substrate-binding protein
VSGTKTTSNADAQRISEVAAGLTRRVFLRRTSAAALAVAGGGLLAACGGEGREEEAAPPAPKEDGELTVWYLASGTNPEADKRWYQATARLFEKESGARVRTVAQTLDGFITAWKSAVAAKQGPDLQYLWEGIFTLEDAWLGNIEPQSAFLDRDEIDHWLGIASVTWDGEVWNSPHTLDSLGLVYNASLFQKAGLDPDEPLETWDEFTNACAKLKASGVTPLGFGLKDGFGGGWLYTAWARAHLDNVADEMRAVIGEGEITDERHSEWWFRLAELRDKGYFNDDIGSVGLFDSLNRFPQEKVGMVLTSVPSVGRFFSELGVEKVRVLWIIPTFGDGALAKRNVTIFSGGLVITAFSEAKELAAEFNAFRHRPERVNALFAETEDLPADDRFDTGLLTEEWSRQLFDTSKTNPGPWLEDWIPTQMDVEANFAGCQALFAGESPDEQVERTRKVLEKWRRENPQLLESYTRWIDDAEKAYA